MNLKFWIQNSSEGKTDGEIKKVFFDCQEKCKNDHSSWEVWDDVGNKTETIRKCPLDKICTPRFKTAEDSQGYDYL